MAQPRTTVLFLLYNEERYVPGIVEGIIRQKKQDAFDAIFIDNGSRDGTLKTLEAELDRVGRPPNCRIKRIPVNQGIAGAMNLAFAELKTPYVLTCHCDVSFGDDSFIEKMTSLMEAHPRAGAIAGQPAIPSKARLPFAEKVNLVANLMDVFPSSEELVPVGFVEGRCDIFRSEALRAAGFYDTTLRLAGEDQVLSAKMREAGYSLYQAPALRYSLSVSSDQDSLMKLVRHQRLFGRAHPYIVLRHAHSRHGLVGEAAGANRRLRTLLRASQLLSALVYAWALVAAAARLPAATWLAPLFVLVGLKLVLFSKHLRAVRLSPKELLLFFAMQPALDLSYTVGLLHGLWLVTGRRETRAIS